MRKAVLTLGSLFAVFLVLVQSSVVAFAEVSPEETEDSDISIGLSGDVAIGDSGYDRLFITANEVVLAAESDAQAFSVSSPLAGGAYISATTLQLGEVKIYVPVDFQRDSFTVDTSGNLVSLRSSTISGLMYSGSNTYNFRISAFGNPTYRLYDSSYSYSDLTMTDILDTNVQIVRSDSELPLYPDSDLLYILIFMVVEVVAVWLFMRR